MDPTRPPRLRLHGVARVHEDGTQALSGVDLMVQPGELIGIIGPSGSGKSTLLRVLGGIEPIAEGLITFDDDDVADLPPAERGMAWVATADALGALLDAIDQDARATGSPPPTRWQPGTPAPRARQGRRRFRTPSGMPTVLLADDPLRGADPPSQVTLRTRLLRIQAQAGLTVLWAANDHAHVLGVADRVVVLRGGRLQQLATVPTLLARPASRWVAGFVNGPPMTFVTATVRDEVGLGWLELGSQRLRMPGGLPGPLREREGTPVDLGARPADVRQTMPGDRADLRLDGIVEAVHPLGHHDEVVVALDGGAWTARFAPGSGLARGDGVEVTIDARALSAFDPASGRAIWHGLG